jgi:hypothetical protein
MEVYMRLLIVLVIVIAGAGCEKRQHPASQTAQKKENPPPIPPGKPGSVSVVSGPSASQASKQIKLKAFIGNDGSALGKELENSDLISLTGDSMDTEFFNSSFDRTVGTSVIIGCPGATPEPLPEKIEADLVKICGKVDLSKVKNIRSKILELESAEISIDDSTLVFIGHVETKELVLRGYNSIELKSVVDREMRRNLILGFHLLSDDGTLQINTRGLNGRTAR